MIRQNQYQTPGLRIAIAMVVFSISILFLYFAQPVLLPLTYAAIAALLLYPLSRFFENNGFPRMIAILLTMFIVLCIITGIVMLIVREVSKMASDLPEIKDKLDNLLSDMEWYLFKNYNIRLPNLNESFFQGSPTKFFDSGVVLLGGTISTFLTLFNLVGLLPYYVFLMLLYRSSFKEFILGISKTQHHKIVVRILYQSQKLIQNYIIGLLTVMIIVATLTSTALFIIGVDYPIFFGSFAAMLIVIPYLGMIIGALLPAIYAFVTKDSGWAALSVMLSFGFIQFLEGNFITPKITGNRVNINPLAAIIALVAGGYLWGMGGLIIALPIVAIVKVLLSNIPSLKHYSVLLGTEIYSNKKARAKRKERMQARRDGKR